MNKFNKNIIVFVFFVVFIIVGIWGNCFEQLKWRTIDLAAGIKHGNISSFFDYKYYIDDISNKELSYHNEMMDVNSVKDNFLGTRIIKKDDSTVVKADSGSLTEVKDKVSDDDIKTIVESVSRLKMCQKVMEQNSYTALHQEKSIMKPILKTQLIFSEKTFQVFYPK